MIAALLAQSFQRGAEEVGQSSPIALAVVLLLLLAVVLLVRSMNKHLRRLPESFDEPRNSQDDDQSG